MNRTFDFYEYAGFVIPGAVLVMAVVWLFPESRALLSKEGVTLGELGLFVIISYAAGQLVQAIGNYLEWAWWKAWDGMPSVRVLCGERLSPDQHKRLLDALRPALGGAEPNDVSQADRSAIVREVYAEVSSAGKSARVDTFNGDYGLMRGLAAAFIAIFILASIAGKGLSVLAALVVLFVLAAHRMHRYSHHYATELFLQFLALRKNSSPTQS